MDDFTASEIDTGETTIFIRPRGSGSPGRGARRSAAAAIQNLLVFGTSSAARPFHPRRRRPMALTYPHAEPAPARHWGLAYGWSGFAAMWAFWASFVIFLAEPRWAPALWPLPTVDSGGLSLHPLAAAPLI